MSSINVNWNVVKLVQSTRTVVWHCYGMKRYSKLQTCPIVILYSISANAPSKQQGGRHIVIGAMRSVDRVITLGGGGGGGRKPETGIIYGQTCQNQQFCYQICCQDADTWQIPIATFSNLLLSGAKNASGGLQEGLGRPFGCVSAFGSGMVSLGWRLDGTERIEIPKLPNGSLLGCPGQEVRINGERINGLVITDPYKWDILGLPSLKLTYPLKMDGSNTSFLLEHLKWLPSLKLTASSPLKIGLLPQKEMKHLPIIHL